MSTGALIAGLVADGHRVAVLTATRGERGEFLPDLAGLEPEQRIVQRECELRRALAELGVQHRGWLGTAPARIGGALARRYTDSGMVWLSDQLAGPAPDAPSTALSRAPKAEAAADLAAFCADFGADVVVSYDHAGGYGHPDHVACSQIMSDAALTARRIEIVSDGARDQPGVVMIDRPDQSRKVAAALASYSSQLRVEGDQLVHVGGQRQPWGTAVWLRCCE